MVHVIMDRLMAWPAGPPRRQPVIMARPMRPKTAPEAPTYGTFPIPSSGLTKFEANPPLTPLRR